MGGFPVSDYKYKDEARELLENSAIRIPKSAIELLNHHNGNSSVLCPAGYRSEDDKYARLPKVRFDQDEMVSHL